MMRAVPLLLCLFPLACDVPGKKEAEAAAERALLGEAKRKAKELVQAAEDYYAKHKAFPDSLERLGLPAEKLADPWGKPFRYDPAGENTGGNRPDVWAVSPKGVLAGSWMQ
jgi:hypothetical protein